MLQVQGKEVTGVDEEDVGEGIFVVEEVIEVDSGNIWWWWGRCCNCNSG